MSRTKRRQFITTMPWVILLTLLIWAVTENLYTSDLDGQLLTVELSAARPLLARAADGERLRVSVDFRGPKASIQELETRIKAGLFTIRLDVPADIEPGERSFSVRELLAENQELRKAGLTAVAANPPAIRVQVDRLGRYEYPIIGEFPELVVEGAQFDPPLAIVEMAESVHESRGREIRVVASLNLQTIPPDGLVNGEVVLLVLRKGGEVKAALVTRSAKLTAKVEALVRQRTFDVPISVRASMPTEMLNRYRIEYKDESELRVNNLTVKGPPDGVGGLRPEEIHAEFRIRPQDQAAQVTWVQREVVFDLPTGVSVVGPPPTISFKLVP